MKFGQSISLWLTHQYKDFFVWGVKIKKVANKRSRGSRLASKIWSEKGALSIGDFVMGEK